jgi:hypothetical protein
VATALAGGGLSLAAYRMRTAPAGAPGRSNRLYLASYILMSLSIALFTVAGFLG